MLNTAPFNTTYLNEIKSNWVSELIPSGYLSYNGYSFDDDYISLKDVDYESLPDIEVTSYDNPLNNGRTLTGYYFRDSKIYASCVVTAGTKAELEGLLTQIKARLSEPNKKLVISESNRYISFDAFLSKTSQTLKRTKYNRNRAVLDLEFTSFDFGRDVNHRIEEYKNITSFTHEFTFENNGASSTYLQFILKINSASSLSKIIIRNENTNQEIELTRTFSNNEYITINGEPDALDIILAPEELLDFNGVFPILQVGHNVFTLAVTSSSHDIDLVLKTKFTY